MVDPVDTLIVYQAKREAYIAAAIAYFSRPATKYIIQYADKQTLSKANEGKPIPRANLCVIIGDVGLTKIIDSVKPIAGRVVVFTHENKRLTVEAVKSGYFPADIMNAFNCQLSADHNLRALAATFSTIPPNDIKTPVARGIDVVIERVNGYDWDKQFEMLACVSVEEMRALGNAELVFDRLTDVWESFGYSESSSESEDDEDDATPSQPTTRPTVTAASDTLSRRKPKK